MIYLTKSVLNYKYNLRCSISNLALNNPSAQEHSINNEKIAL